jgi:hypothetical protein
MLLVYFVKRRFKRSSLNHHAVDFATARENRQIHAIVAIQSH